nr:hepatitis A virus cellular receptor 1 homolog [Peromyscus maniculatus bairdii]
MEYVFHEKELSSEEVAGHPVTLSCTYSPYRGITATCWGRQACSYGYCVTYQRSSRYQLKGHISGGNVSLTIENAVQSDSGLYCCRVDVPGHQIVNFSLDVKPEIPRSLPTRPTTTWRPTTPGKPTTPGRPTTISIRPTHVPTSSRVSTSSSTTPAHTQTHIAEPTTIYPHQTTAEVTETPSYTLADWNYTVTSSHEFYSNYTELK